MLSPFEWVRNPRLLLDWLARVGGTHVWLPNFALGHLVNACADDEPARFDLRSVKRLVCCSEPVLKGTVDGFAEKFRESGLAPDCLQNCFAMAENTFAMTSTREGPIRFLSVDPELFRKEHRIRPAAGGRPIASTGVPLENIQIEVRSDGGAALPDDHVGEIWIRSDCMLDSYHNNWEETQRSMLDGWFKTGDLGFFHDGELYVTGRSKEMLIIGGENIYPQDIEAILNEKDYLIPGRNVAFGVENPRTGTERLVILAETKPEHMHVDLVPLRTEILNALGVSVSRLALVPHMTLVKGTAGKISRYLNKQAYLEGKFNRVTGARRRRCRGHLALPNDFNHFAREATAGKAGASPHLERERVSASERTSPSGCHRASMVSADRSAPQFHSTKYPPLTILWNSSGSSRPSNASSPRYGRTSKMPTRPSSATMDSVQSG